MWPKRYFSASYWAQRFWGPVVATDNSGAVSAYRYELTNNNLQVRANTATRYELTNTNQRTQ